MIYLISILGFLITALIAIQLYIKLNPEFGAVVSADDRLRYSKSPHWDGKTFVNQSLTEMDVNLRTMPKIIGANRKNAKVKAPKKNLEFIPFDKEAWNQMSEPAFTWFGHSVLLMKLNGQTILIDPMFGPDASPIAPFKTKRFTSNTLDIIDQLPPIDLVLFTHDHYDHLDLKSVKKLIPKVKQWKTLIGVGRHLKKWGVSPSIVQEYDWWDEFDLNGIHVTCTPNRHFGGRGATDRAKSFWGGWVFETEAHKIYWSGDGGYDTHFKQIGEKFGGFDWVFMECGQYGEYWHPIHNFPEEAIQASIDVKAKRVIPVHWGGFALANHGWKESIDRFTEGSIDKEYAVCTPKIGELFSTDYVPNQRWWEKYD